MKIKTGSRGLVGLKFGVFAVLAFVGATMTANAAVPDCMAKGRKLPVDNASVIELKKSAPLGKPFRAHVSGRVTRVFPDRNGHGHFEISIGDGAKDLLEVVYNDDFGAMPTPAPGASVEACGDFINSYARNNGFPPSPSGAIIHWVHQANGGSHDAGYVVVDNIVYGLGPDRKGPNWRPGRRGGGESGEESGGGHHGFLRFDFALAN